MEKVLILCVLFISRQGGKDQTKKGPNVKLGQGDKKGLGQDPRKDGSMDGGHHLKVCLKSTYSPSTLRPWMRKQQ